MHKLLQDFRFTVRQWRKHPGFALTTMLTLALGIGATTAIFSLVNTILLRPLAFPEPDRLVHVGERLRTSSGETSSSGGSSLSYPDFFDMRSQNHSLEGLASYHDNNYTLTGAGDPVHLFGYVVSGEFFRVLGVNPELGRGFVPADEKPGMHVVVLSRQLWQSRFGSNPNIVGRAVTLDNLAYTVVGVMPAAFSFPIQNPAPALWTSLGDDAVDAGVTDPLKAQPITVQRGAHLLDVTGRLRPGVSAQQAQADLTVIASNLAKQYPDSNKKFDAAVVMPEMEHLVGDTRPALRVLFAAVGFVLLIACVNVAGLLLARVSRRRSEIAVRAAMGASRSEIVRQVLFESVLLSLAGGVLGVAFSVALLHSVLHFVPENLPRLDQVSVDINVLVFAVAVSVATGILFGVLPAWRMSRLDPSIALREGARSLNTGRGQHRLHDSLVVAETAIGLVLLVGAGLLIHSFVRILHVDPGFDPHNVLTARVALPDNRYNGQQQVQFYNQLLPRLAALPGVQSVAAGWSLPLSNQGMRIGFDIEGHSLPPGDRPAAGAYIITPTYFQTLRIPILQGRAFEEQDTGKSPLVVAVNESFVRKYFSNENALGKRLQIGLGDGYVDSKAWREVVAVVADVRDRKLTTEAKPEYYLPYTQAAALSPDLVIRTVGDPVALIPSLRAQLAQMDKTVPLYEVKTMEDWVSQASAQPRFQTLVISLFAGMALALSAIGLYAVLSYMVAQRSLEIGLRMAVGAQRSDVLSLVLRRGLVLASAGLGIGIVVSLALTRFLEGMLYGVRSFDPLTFVAVSTVLLLVALVASSAPAYRAARLDPMNTLREQ